MQSVLTRTDSLTKPLSEFRMGKYVLLRQLGQGGSATIYLAEQISCKSQVVLKEAIEFVKPPSKTPRLCKSLRRDKESLSRLSARAQALCPVLLKPPLIQTSPLC